VMGPLMTGSFVIGHFVMGRFVGESHNNQSAYKYYLLLNYNHPPPMLYIINS
jgi:hypothetical protein